MKKKAFCGCLALLLLLAAFACGKSEPKESSGTAAPETAAPTEAPTAAPTEAPTPAPLPEFADD